MKHSEPLSQRSLTFELKAAIDRTRSALPAHVAVLERGLRELLATHPVGVASSHVRHNLGTSRRAWLDQFVEEQMVRPQDTPPPGTGEALKRADVPTQPPKETAEQPARSANLGAGGVIRGDAVPTKKG